METQLIARELLEESIVLLKNESSLLPLASDAKVAFFGRTNIDTIYSGNGSGAANVQNAKNILQACEEKGLIAEPNLKEYYLSTFAADPRSTKDEGDFEKFKEMINSGLMYEIFGKYQANPEEYPVSADLMTTARAFTDTAILTIGRCAGGEECDRHLENDFYLSESEKALIDQVCDTFPNVVLILNINGLIDLSWTEEKESIKSILFLGIPGQEGPFVLANILTGETVPSGKLAFTIARDYEDYPSARHFSWNKDCDEEILSYESYGLEVSANVFSDSCVTNTVTLAGDNATADEGAKNTNTDGTVNAGTSTFTRNPVTVYQEGLYNGYRYFDTFGKKPLFPFGFGLSYTTFQLDVLSSVKERACFSVKVVVRNTGTVAAKETVQLYLSLDTPNRPIRELKVFEKTEPIEPEKTEFIIMSVPWKSFAIYDEASASYIIPQGLHGVYVGNSSNQLTLAAHIIVPEAILVEKLSNRLSLADNVQGKIDFLTAPAERPEEDIPISQFAAAYPFTAEDYAKIPAPFAYRSGLRFDKAEAKAEELVKELTIEQLLFASASALAFLLPLFLIQKLLTPSPMRKENHSPAMIIRWAMPAMYPQPWQKKASHPFFTRMALPV